MLTEERVERLLKVADEAVSLGGKTGNLVTNVDGLVSNVKAGKGTVGALLVREEIYADLREMLRDLKKNPWKFFWKE
jgi:phospholipid/cholesterol/gamma-HCH transport system substrate-binding protein